jgi:Sec-independent protein secretion pathway component TatC
MQLRKRIIKSTAAAILAFLISMTFYGVGDVIYAHQVLARNTEALRSQLQSANTAPTVTQSEAGFETNTNWSDVTTILVFPPWIAVTAASLLSVVAFLWVFRKTAQQSN